MLPKTKPSSLGVVAFLGMPKNTHDPKSLVRLATIHYNRLTTQYKQELLLVEKHKNRSEGLYLAVADAEKLVEQMKERVAKK